MQNTDNPLRWLPSLYFFKGLPYVVLMVVSTVLYKQMGLSNAEVAFYTSWFYLPWVLKPFWHPYVSRMATRRWWILLTEIIIGASMGSIAFTLPRHSIFRRRWLYSGWLHSRVPSIMFLPTACISTRWDRATTLFILYAPPSIVLPPSLPRASSSWWLATFR